MLINMIKPEVGNAELKFSDMDKVGEWAEQALAQAVHLGIEHSGRISRLHVRKWQLYLQELLI